VRRDHVLDVGAAMQQLVRLRIGGVELLAQVRVVVALGEETRGAEHDQRQAVAAMDQLA
jgi:hypothetical protein